MTTSKKLIVANWKMNPETPREAKDLYAAAKLIASKVSSVDLVLCPPSIFIGFLNHKATKNFSLGMQDVASDKGSGAFTGSVSATMVAYVGAEYTLVGHSERRAAGETDEIINSKIKLALSAELTTILCVGEKERDSHGDYLEVIRTQLEKGLAGIKKTQFKNIIIAYEPVWAIGKTAAVADSPESFFQTALFIRKIVSNLAGKEAAHSIKVLYGGSVSPKNAAGFLEEGKADGLLVGRASLDPISLKNIVMIASGVAKPSKK